VKLDANMFVELMPRDRIEIGMRVLRWDRCRRCGEDWTQELTLLEASPRTWGVRCLRCSQRLREEG